MGFGSGWRTNLKSKLKIKNDLVRECLAEFLGTYILMVFGSGGAAQHVLSTDNPDSFLSASFGWGYGVTFGVWVSLKVSGGHINPCISLAFVIIGRLPLYKLPFYLLSQYLGAFVSSATVFGVYYDALNLYDPGRTVIGNTSTAGIFATYPAVADNPIWRGLLDQIIVTSLLVICVLSITDKNNMKLEPALYSSAIGFLVATLSMTFGVAYGGALNPARDLGPRLFTFAAGWGTEVFTAYNYFFWVPIVGPHIGAILGAWVYLFFIGVHLEDS